MERIWSSEMPRLRIMGRTSRLMCMKFQLGWAWRRKSSSKANTIGSAPGRCGPYQGMAIQSAA